MDGDCGEEVRREDDAAHQDVEEDETLEARRMKMAWSPGEARQAEVQEHWEYGHTPFRSWCRHCVIRQGLAEYHVRDKRRRRADSLIRLRVHGRDRQWEGRRTTIASAVLQVQPNQSAHGRGIAEQGSGQMGDYSGLGHNKVLIDADKENATRELINVVQKPNGK